jgi:hypothetical protein
MRIGFSGQACAHADDTPRVAMDAAAAACTKVLRFIDVSF